MSSWLLGLLRQGWALEVEVEVRRGLSLNLDLRVEAAARKQIACDLVLRIGGIALKVL